MTEWRVNRLSTIIDPFVTIVSTFLTDNEIYSLRLLSKEINEMLLMFGITPIPRRINYFTDFRGLPFVHKFKYREMTYYCAIIGGNSMVIYDKTLKKVRTLIDFMSYRNVESIEETYNTDSRIGIKVIYDARQPKLLQGMIDTNNSSVLIFTMRDKNEMQIKINKTICKDYGKQMWRQKINVSELSLYLFVHDNYLLCVCNKNKMVLFNVVKIKL